MDVYKSLDEALNHIGNENGSYKEAIIKHDKENFFLQDSYIILDKEVKNELVQRSVDGETSYLIRNILSEITTNAYRHGVLKYLKESMLSMAYFSNKGVLLGTQQNKSFLTNHQISVLEQGRFIPSTNKDPRGRLLSSNQGTKVIVDNADGLLIDKENKSLYVSKLF